MFRGFQATNPANLPFTIFQRHKQSLGFRSNHIGSQNDGAFLLTENIQQFSKFGVGMTWPLSIAPTCNNPATVEIVVQDETFPKEVRRRQSHCRSLKLRFNCPRRENIRHGHEHGRELILEGRNLMYLVLHHPVESGVQSREFVVDFPILSEQLLTVEYQFEELQRR